MPEITVYTTPSCVQCKPTKRKLTNAGVPFREVDVTLPENQAEGDRIRALGFAQAPVVITDIDQWNGFDPDRLDAYIARVKESQ